MISILLATYNGERYIKNSIDSIINQTFTDWELLIGFNGTNDLSIDIVNQYNDNRIKIFNYGDEKGKAKTLNKLLLEASRNWIALQDDDDVWLETKLEKQLRFIKDYDLIGTQISYIDEHGNYIGYPNLSTNHEDIIRLSLAGDNQIANTSVIFKKADAIKISGWDTTIDGIEDFDFWLRLIRLGKITINIPEKLVLHRLHDKSNFNTKNYELNKILNK